MKNQELGPELSAFLDSKGLSELFLSRIGNSSRKICCLEEAFIWSKTQEGTKFWEDLAKQYKEEYGEAGRHEQAHYNIQESEDQVRKIICQDGVIILVQY